MARITVEDCLDKVDNRFELVMVASKRARQLQSESQLPLVAADDDKPTVIALREISEGLVRPDILDEVTQMEVESDSAVMAEAVAASEAAVRATNEGGLAELEVEDDEEEEDDESFAGLGPEGEEDEEDEEDDEGDEGDEGDEDDDNDDEDEEEEPEEEDPDDEDLMDNADDLAGDPMDDAD